ncbi:hypothetical protein D9611_003758 [Ephemerocybe angulata]|uniref:Uncharacterized protein n=1 Tax=Ephemerocybe angulata TaxID=980116 RepID=A0A8H5EYR1_9AGAR|nr:hypothetical protein D9611_003758 [Tulosesus angulatus]
MRDRIDRDVEDLDLDPEAALRDSFMRLWNVFSEIVQKKAQSGDSGWASGAGRSQLDGSRHGARKEASETMGGARGEKARETMDGGERGEKAGKPKDAIESQMKEKLKAAEVISSKDKGKENEREHDQEKGKPKEKEIGKDSHSLREWAAEIQGEIGWPLAFIHPMQDMKDPSMSSVLLTGAFVGTRALLEEVGVQSGDYKLEPYFLERRGPNGDIKGCVVDYDLVRTPTTRPSVHLRRDHHTPH